ncbi:putative 2-oxoglutarate-dependent dioxygenase AOP1 [Curcuma longa]|uniref:putative 2-oxoglutarate-dependent dioxygenase AOP1 n=1 Tax=Curcuma longa TaxID=136217 RepID=UPI003D9E579C
MQRKRQHPESRGIPEATMGSDGNQLQIPRVDFRGLSPSYPGGDRWSAAREEAMSALESFGCFEAIYDAVSSDTKDDLFLRALPELFELPTETKMRNEYVGMPYEGYIGQIPNMAFDSLRIQDPLSLHNVQQFTSLMWPDGNPTFSNTIWRYAKQVQELEQMVVRMILQSMDVEKKYDSLVESLTHGVRLSEYGIPLDQETKLSLKEHVDPTMITIVCQYLVDGLEVQTRDRKWIRVESQPNSFNVMLGELFRAWSNGRLHAPLHRVRVTGDQTRYSLIFGCRPKDEIIFQVPKELIDEEHPLRFRPYKYPEYIRFRYSAEGIKHEDPLQVYLGVEGRQVDAPMPSAK